MIYSSVIKDGTSAEMELSVIAECEQESRRCSRVALTSDLQELDLVSRLAKKVRSFRFTTTITITCFF